MKIEIVDIHTVVTRAAQDYLSRAGNDIEEAGLLIDNELYGEQVCPLCRVLATWVLEEARDLLKDGDSESASPAAS